MPELRFIVTGDKDLKKSLAEIRQQGQQIRKDLSSAAREGAKELNKEIAETRKEADRLEKYLKAADQEAKRGLTMSIAQARQLFKLCNNDVSVLKFTLQQAGVKTFDIKVLTQQLTRELKESRREAMGLDGNMNRLRDSIRSGTFQAQAMQAAFERGRAALEAMQRLGKVKGLEDSTKDAMELQDQFDALQEKLDLVGDPKKFAQVKKNIRDISIKSNVPQSQLIQATLMAQESQSAGRELALDNGGALLGQLAMPGYGTRVDSIPEYIKTSVDMMKGLGFTTQPQLADAQGIIRAGEEKGAITSQQISNKGGMFIQQLAQLQGTTGHEALRRGAALFQTMGSAPGINGDFDAANVRLKDMLGKFADPRTRKRLKEGMGIDTLTKEGQLREIPTLLAEMARTGAVPMTEADLREAENDPKKQAKYKDFFEIFREQESRQGVLGLLARRDKIRELERVDPAVGKRLIAEGFEHRVMGGMGQLEQIQRRDEATHLDKLAEKENTIKHTANVISLTQAKHPIVSSVAGFFGDVAGVIGPKAKMVVEGSIASAAMLGSMDTTPTSTRNELVMREADENIKKSQARQQQAEKETAEIKAKIDAMSQGHQTNVNLTVRVQDGMTATVTSDAKTSRQAAQSGTRKSNRPGQK